MKVSDKIELLKSGVKFAELAELEKQEAEELKIQQELNNDNKDSDQTDEQTSKENEEEEAEKHPDQKQLDELQQQLNILKEENEKMLSYIHKLNSSSSGIEDSNKPKKLTGADVMNQLFNPKYNKEDK